MRQISQLNPDHILPKILQRDVVAQSRLFRAEALHLRFSNGEERVYERIPGGKPACSHGVPVQPDGTMLLVRRYAAALTLLNWGFPKGAGRCWRNGCGSG